MVDLKGSLIYTADAALTTATGSSNTVRVAPGAPTVMVQINIEADALTTSATKVEIQGRTHADAAWVILKKADNSTEASVTASSGALVDVAFPVQAMPLMRVKHSGTYAATAGNDIRVWLLGQPAAARADS